MSCFCYPTLLCFYPCFSVTSPGIFRHRLPPPTSSDGSSRTVTTSVLSRHLWRWVKQKNLCVDFCVVYECKRLIGKPDDWVNGSILYRSCCCIAYCSWQYIGLCKCWPNLLATLVKHACVYLYHTRKSNQQSIRIIVDLQIMLRW